MARACYDPSPCILLLFCFVIVYRDYSVALLYRSIDFVYYLVFVESCLPVLSELLIKGVASK